MKNYDELLKRLDARVTVAHWEKPGQGLVPPKRDPDCFEAAVAIRALQAEVDKAYANGLEDAAKCCDAEALHCHDNAALAIMGSTDPYDIYMNGSSGAAMALADEIRGLIPKDEVTQK